MTNVSSAALFNSPYGGDSQGENGSHSYRGAGKTVKVACYEAFLEADENSDFYWATPEKCAYSVLRSSAYDMDVDTGEGDYWVDNN